MPIGDKPYSHCVSLIKVKQKAKTNKKIRQGISNNNHNKDKEKQQQQGKITNKAFYCAKA